jgi:hypothetical protein
MADPAVYPNQSGAGVPDTNAVISNVMNLLAIASYEPAYRIQASAPTAVDLAGETAATKSLYGFDCEETAGLGCTCLLARRRVERGTRFVQIYQSGLCLSNHPVAP